MTWNDHGGEFAGKELWAETMQLIGAQVNAYQGSSTVKRLIKISLARQLIANAGQFPFLTISVPAHE